jgi:hypothetical protein
VIDMTNKLPSKKFWNDAKVMTKHWEDTIRASATKCQVKDCKRQAVHIMCNECLLAFPLIYKIAHDEATIRADERRKITEEGTKKCSQCKCEMNEHQLLHYDCLKHVKQEAYKKGQADLVERLKGELNKNLVQSEKDYSFYSGLNGDVRKVARAEGECFAFRIAIKKASEIQTIPPSDTSNAVALKGAEAKGSEKDVTDRGLGEPRTPSLRHPSDCKMKSRPQNEPANSAPENAKEEEFNVWLERLVNFYQNKKAIETKPEKPKKSYGAYHSNKACEKTSAVNCVACDCSCHNKETKPENAFQYCKIGEHQPTEYTMKGGYIRCGKCNVFYKETKPEKKVRK